MKRFLLPLALAAIALSTACSNTQQAEELQSWAPAGDNIMTRWAAEVSPTNAHPEYPRPQLVRKDWKSLNGLWEYAITSAETDAMDVADGHILVPFCVESALSGVGRTLTAEDALWYRTTFTVPRSWKGKRLLLNFDAVDWKADVYVNDQHVGTHTGGYTAFTYDITPYLNRKGEQKLVVKVLDATNNDMQPRGKQTMTPRSIWYTAVSGIWQNVWMEPVSDSYIADFGIASDIDESTLSVTPYFKDFKEGDEVEVSVIDGKIGYDPLTPGSTVIASTKVAPEQTAELTIPDMKKWSPDSPYLYGLKFRLMRKGRVIDEVDSYTAMRTVSTVTDADGNKRIGLNGEAVFNYGPLDQGWWPDGLYTAPTDEALRYDVEMTKTLGFNTIRKHIKVEPARWYYHCDALGIMVWQDMPSFTARGNEWGQDTNSYDTGTDYPASEEYKAIYYQEWSTIMAQLKKNQCIVMWVPFNEAWGQFDTKAVVDFTYAQDGSRLVNHASGGNWVSGGVGDVIDSHNYPEPGIRVWDKNLIVVLGEYGGIGRPVEGHLWQKDKNWGYVQYQSAEEVTDEYVHFTELLKPLVEKGCSAAIYTQTTDVEGEVNGLMTYDREINKVDVEKVAAANKSVIELLRK